MIVEVMGRHVGWIALNSGMAGGAHYIVVPEAPFDIADICKAMERRFQMGEKYGIIVAPRGHCPRKAPWNSPRAAWTSSATAHSTALARSLVMRFKSASVTMCAPLCWATSSVVEHPRRFDRVLATRFGVHAARACHTGSFGKCVALRGEHIDLIELEEAVGTLKTVPLGRYRTAQALFG